MCSTEIENVKATATDLESARMPKRVFEIELSLSTIRDESSLAPSGLKIYEHWCQWIKCPD